MNAIKFMAKSFHHACGFKSFRDDVDSKYSLLCIILMVIDDIKIQFVSLMWKLFNVDFDMKKKKTISLVIGYFCIHTAI